MEARLTLEGVDLDRFRAWMEVQIPIFEDAIQDAVRMGRAAPVVYGWQRRPFSHYWEFCAVTPTKKQVEQSQIDIFDRSSALREMRGEPIGRLEDYADLAWMDAAGENRIQALFQRSAAHYDNRPEWLYLPKDDAGQLRDKIVSAWITAENYTIGRLKVTFWRDDRQPGYDALLDALKSDFAGTWQEDAAAGFPGKTSAPPATAEIPQSDAGNTAIETQPDDQAGAPAWANQDWYLGMSINERERYDRLRPHKKDWEAGNITDAELAKLFSKHITTVARWRRELKKQKAPDMDWHKQQGSAKGSA